MGRPPDCLVARPLACPVACPLNCNARSWACRLFPLRAPPVTKINRRPGGEEAGDRVVAIDRIKLLIENIPRFGKKLEPREPVDRAVFRITVHDQERS